MKTRSAYKALSVLLIVALLWGVFPAAYAENKTGLPEAFSMAADAGNGLPEIGFEEPVPALSREEAMLNFLRLVMEAEAEQDPAQRAALCKQAEELWNAYLESAPTGSVQSAEALARDPQKLERRDMLFDLMQYIMAAETENDPAARASLYLQADAIWYSYLSLINSAAEPEEHDPEQQKALQDFLISMTDPDMDPDEQQRFLEEAEKLWDTFYGLVMQAMEEASAPETNAPEEPAEKPEPQEENEPEAKPEDEPHVESYTFYANSWEELENMFSDIMNGIMTVNPDETPAIGLPNPWTETMWLEEAEHISGIAFDLDQQALPQGMKLQTCRAMKGTIETDFSDGENELMIRASTIDEGYTLSGDYNSYSKEWTEKIGEVTVDCLGDGKTVNVASYKTGDVAVAITMACGLEGQGLTKSELKALVTGLKAGTMRHGNHMDVYADPWDAWENFFEGPFGPFTSIYGGHNAASDGETEDSQKTQTTPKTGTETRTGTDAKTGTDSKTGTETRPGHSHRDRGGNSYCPGFYYGYGN